MNAYYGLVDTVRQWLNRDESVLPDAVIQSSLEYAADTAYRTLEIPPFEATRFYIARDYTEGAVKYCRKVSDGFYELISSCLVEDAIIEDPAYDALVDTAVMPIPSDTVSFIYLRVTGKTVRPPVGSLVGSTTITSDNQNDYAVLSAQCEPMIGNPMTGYEKLFNEKASTRDVNDNNVRDSKKYVWARKGNLIVASGKVKHGDIFELFYRRNLPTLNAREDLPEGLTKTDVLNNPDLYEYKAGTDYDALITQEKITYTLIDTEFYVRSVERTYNWLLDDNEKVLLFGALWRCFDYLHEDTNAEKYKSRYNDSLAELNAEEKRRAISGGFSTTNYRSELL